METRNAKLIVNKSGGSSGKGGVTFRVTLPTNWVREIGFGEDHRELKLKFDGNNIIIEKNTKPRGIKMLKVTKKETVETAKVLQERINSGISENRIYYNNGILGIETILGSEKYEFEHPEYLVLGNYILYKEDMGYRKPTVKFLVQYLEELIKDYNKKLEGIDAK